MKHTRALATLCVLMTGANVVNAKEVPLGQMGNGCTIQLAPAQHLRIAAGLNCSQLQASVKQLFSPYQTAQAPVPGSTPVATPTPPNATVLQAGKPTTNNSKNG